jgi:hypothetical protein
MFILLVFNYPPLLFHDRDKVDNRHVLVQFAYFTFHDLHTVHTPFGSFHKEALDLLPYFRPDSWFVLGS